jgi:hypothetical protein
VEVRKKERRDRERGGKKDRERSRNIKIGEMRK